MLLIDTKHSAEYNQQVWHHYQRKNCQRQGKEKEEKKLNILYQNSLYVQTAVLHLYHTLLAQTVELIKEEW